MSKIPINMKPCICAEPFHRTISQNHFTKPFHRTISQNHFTEPFHKTILQNHFTEPFVQNHFTEQINLQLLHGKTK